MQSIKYHYFKLTAMRWSTGSKIVRVVSRCEDKRIGLADAIFDWQNEMNNSQWEITGVVVAPTYALQWLRSQAYLTDRYIGSEAS